MMATPVMADSSVFPGFTAEQRAALVAALTAAAPPPTSPADDGATGTRVEQAVTTAHDIMARAARESRVMTDEERALVQVDLDRAHAAAARRTPWVANAIDILAAAYSKYWADCPPTLVGSHRRRRRPRPTPLGRVVTITPAMERNVRAAVQGWAADVTIHRAPAFDTPQTPAEIRKHLMSTAKALERASALVRALPDPASVPADVGYALTLFEWRAADDRPVTRASWLADSARFAHELRSGASSITVDKTDYDLHALNRAVGEAVFRSTDDLQPAVIRAVLKALEEVEPQRDPDDGKLIAAIQTAAGGVYLRAGTRIADVAPALTRRRANPRK